MHIKPQLEYAPPKAFAKVVREQTPTGVWFTMPQASIVMRLVVSGTALVPLIAAAFFGRSHLAEIYDGVPTGLPRAGFALLGLVLLVMVFMLIRSMVFLIRRRNIAHAIGIEGGNLVIIAPTHPVLRREIPLARVHRFTNLLAGFNLRWRLHVELVSVTTPVFNSSLPLLAASSKGDLLPVEEELNALLFADRSTPGIKN